MRIISKFHDYYDSVMGHGQDESCLYLRRTKVFDLEKDKNVSPLVKDIGTIIDEHSKEDELRKRSLFRSRTLGVDTTHTKLNTYDWGHFSVLFCGKLYKGISINKTDRRGMYCTKKAHFYSTEAVEAYMAKEGIKNKVIDPWWRSKATDIVNLANKYFSDVKQPDLNWMIANKVICVMQEGSTITVNPSLKDVQFYKVFEAYTAFQELDMWISGTLAYPQNEMIEVADKYKIIGHGFDEKYGFRTRPKSLA